MRLTTKGQYAVRAMVNLATQGTEKPVTLKAISKAEGISLAYLEQLFGKLRRGGIVKSVRGPGGGYIFATSPKDVSVGDVISVVEEPLNPVECLDEGFKGCDKFDVCVTKNVWKVLGEKIREFLDSISIEDLSTQAIDLSKEMEAKAAASGETKAEAQAS